MMLRIGGEGLVPLTLSWQELAALPEPVVHRSQLFGGADLVGVRLQTVLLRVHPPASARFVTVRSQDGYETTLSLAELGDAVLIFKWGADALSSERGGPFRLVVDPAQPRRCLKHVVTLELVSRPAADILPSCTHEPAQPSL
jgi:DMSO/TMAO reductase YedYZ molybdopterin-dependent catalytic subunit